jgi:hypothetical protein
MTNWGQSFRVMTNWGRSFRVRQFKQAVLTIRFRSKASIFVRKTLQVLPCEIKKAFAFLSSQKGPAFFDEDDVCDGF